MTEYADHFDIVWQDRGRPPLLKPNPDYPDGVDLDIRAPSQKGGPFCTVKIPYPTGQENIGTWLIRCQKCGFAVGITAASRADDPRSAILPCKEIHA